MKKTIQKMLNEYEKNFPDEKHLNDLAIEDMLSNGVHSPAKPLIMHVAYDLDGHTNGRDVFNNNYDRLIQEDEKQAITDEILENAELSALLHHPEYILEESDHRSQNQDVSKDILLYLLAKYGPEKEGYNQVMKELFSPMLSTLLDKVIDKDTYTKQVLGPAMVTRTPHHHNDFNRKLDMAFTAPIIQGAMNQNWRRALPEIFKSLQGEKND